jgi:hypothetical protein
MDFPGLVERKAFSKQCLRNANHQPASIAPMSADWPGGRQIVLQKKQGRRRNITLTALQTPDIEIGSRHPVNCSLPRECTIKCDLFHKSARKPSNQPLFGGLPAEG